MKKNDWLFPALAGLLFLAGCAVAPTGGLTGTGGNYSSSVSSDSSSSAISHSGSAGSSLSINSSADSSQSVGVQSSSSQYSKALVLAVYVSTNGSDSNPGTNKSAPIRSIQKAADMADYGATIYVQDATYTNGFGLNAVGTNGILITNSGLTISGGWNYLFTTQLRRSVLKGSGGNYKIIFINNASNIVLDNFEITGGSNDFGGGAYLENVTYTRITNCVFSNNMASEGGGLFLYRSSYNAISGAFYYNSAGSGGGLLLYQSGNCTINGYFFGNSAYFGGGIDFVQADYNTVNGQFYGNSSVLYGGGLIIDNSVNNTIYGVVSNNTAHEGGGIYYNTSSFNSNFCLISYNSNFGVVTNNSCAGNSFGTVINNIPDNFTNNY